MLRTPRTTSAVKKSPRANVHAASGTPLSLWRARARRTAVSLMSSPTVSRPLPARASAS